MESEPGKRVETRVHVELGPRSYDIVVTSNGWDGLGAFAYSLLKDDRPGAGAPRAVGVSESRVESLGLVADCKRSLERAGVECEWVIVPAGEPSKSLEQTALLYDALAAFKADRRCGVIALGGGVIGDLAGFAASTYNRGLPLVMVPTTLLAQVDSSVGGKVGVNHKLAKNVIGAFHQPRGVWIDVALLSTLPERTFRAGLAEVVKYGVILDAAFFEELERDRDRILGRDPQALARIVAHSCLLKARVVEQDEREETGLRAILNFGHTIGHAIESVAGYGVYEHGEAVAIGMAAETRLAQNLGWVSHVELERLTALLEAFALPTRFEGLESEALIAAMTRDKKNRGGKIRFVLPKAIGRVEETDQATGEDLGAVLAWHRASPAAGPRS